MRVTVPAHLPDLKPVEIARNEMTHGVVLVVRVVPSWPCYPEDGAGKVTHLCVEQSLVVTLEGGSREFTVTECENE